MYKRIPETRTWSVNNKVTWSILRKQRTKNTSNEESFSWTDTGRILESTEPQPMSAEDQAFILATEGSQGSFTLSRIWVKDVPQDLDLIMYEYALIMQDRTTPYGENLALDSGEYILTTNQINTFKQREIWISLKKMF